MQQAGRFGGHVVQVSLQSSAHQQRVSQVCDVDAHDGKGVAGAEIRKRREGLKETLLYLLGWFYRTDNNPHFLFDFSDF